ncbi:MAG TPA: hypothetical protein VL346_12190 [Acidobacteriaceae bacterium]|nr:hypothetical protein [Acidobacteriaceae bacterium]
MEWAVRISPLASREWARAMLRELDFVEGEWGALRWALGSAAVLARGAGVAWVREQRERRRRLAMRKLESKDAGWLLVGALSTVALSLAALGLLFAIAVAFPQLGLDHAEWTHVLFVIVLPLAACLGAAVWLWRRRRPAAIGILLSAVAISTHVVMHFAHHVSAR